MHVERLVQIGGFSRKVWLLILQQKIEVIISFYVMVLYYLVHGWINEQCIFFQQCMLQKLVHHVQ